MEIDDALLESGKAALGAVLEAVQRVRDGLASGEGYDAEADLASIEASVGQCMSVLDGDAPEAVPAPEGGGELKTTTDPVIAEMARSIVALGNEIKAMRGEAVKQTAAQAAAAKRKEADDVFNPLVSGGFALAEDREVFDAIAKTSRGLSGAADHFKAKGVRSGLPAQQVAQGAPAGQAPLNTNTPDTPDMAKRRAELDVLYKKHGVLDEKTRSAMIEGSLRRDAEIEYERMN